MKPNGGKAAKTLCSKMACDRNSSINNPQQLFCHDLLLPFLPPSNPVPLIILISV